MEKRLIWDLPTRVFHWGFAGSVLSALVLAKTAPEESPLFYLHIVFGVAAGLLLIWRLIWGFIGSSHARFAALLFTPQEVVRYAKSVVSGKGEYHAGHNPGGSLAIWGFFVLIGLAVVSGFGMVLFGEAFEEIHEFSTNFTIIVIALHLVGIVAATVMNKENYVGAMFSGKKRAKAEDAIPHSSRAAAFLMLALVFTGIAYFVRGFDLQNGVFRAPGTAFEVMLGEHGRHGGSEHDHHGEGHGDHDDDDDGDED